MFFSPGTRRRRPLYPMARGAGKKKRLQPLTDVIQSLLLDVTILKTFREVSHLRFTVQFPITFINYQNFMARNAKKSGPPSQSRGTAVRGRRSKSQSNKASTTDSFIQYCGVLEFSSPEGVCHLPHWMMESLNVREGGRITLRSAPRLPKGDFARFQPHKEEFLDFAMALGVRNVLELAMQHYSALAVGQTVVIQYGNDKYFLDVVEVNPGSAISLYGTVNLKVEFAPVAGSAAALAAAAELQAANKENNVDDIEADDVSVSSVDSPPATGRSRATRGPTTPASTRESKNRARPRLGGRSSRTSPVTPRGGTKKKDVGNRKKNQRNTSTATSNKFVSRTSTSSLDSTSPPSPSSAAAIQSMQKRRQDKLSKFRKRGSKLGLARAVDGPGGSGVGTSTKSKNVKQSTLKGTNQTSMNPPTISPVQPQQRLGRSLASGATVPLSTNSNNNNNISTEGKERKEGKEEDDNRQPATWGTGHSLNSGAKVHSNDIIAPPKAPASAETNSTDVPEATKEKEIFSGKGATLGNSKTSNVEVKPWVAAARARHERYAKKQAEELLKKHTEEKEIKKEIEEKCRAIAEAAAAAMSEEDKAKQVRKDELEAKRFAIESQIEDKLLRDAELKVKREEKRERVKRERTKRNVDMDQQVEDLEALALAHAVQQSVESDVKNKGRRKRQGQGDVEDAMLNAALMESAKSSHSASKSTFDSLLTSASNELKSDQRPRAPSDNKGRGVTPPDGRKKRGPGKSGRNGGGLLKQYEKQLELLREMGFANSIEAATALEASGGDVSRAVDLLSGMFFDVYAIRFIFCVVKILTTLFFLFLLLFLLFLFSLFLIGASPPKAAGSAVNAARRRKSNGPRTSIMDRARTNLRGNEKEDQPLRSRRQPSPRTTTKSRVKKTSMTPAERRARGDAMKQNRMSKK